MKILAIDFGTKRIGLATGDSDLGMSFPNEVFANEEGVLKKIVGFCGEWEIGKVLVGLPLNMEDGQDANPVLKKVKGFVSELGAALGDLELEFFDERLSSYEADRLMDEAGLSFQEKKEKRDAYAACVILQRYFDRV